MIIRYSTLLRPPGPGAVPRDGLKDCGYTEHTTPSGHHAWGWAEYSRELTPEELHHYDMERTTTTNEEGKKMKKSEAITASAAKISDALINAYRAVLESGGRMQYKVYLWDDGDVQTLPGVQGDTCRLEPRAGESRNLYYLTTVEAPGFDPWDAADHSAPDDPDERSAEEAEIIDWTMDAYKENLYSILDNLLLDAEREEL